MNDSTIDLTGKTCLVTGANTGIGRVTAVALAKMGAKVFVAGRSLERTQATLDEIAALPKAPTPTFLELDLGRLDSVKACAAAFLKHDVPLHILINNAGLAKGKSQTHDGFEMCFGVNHLGHFLLTQLLLERLKASAPARVVTVASRAHYRAKTMDFSVLTSPGKSAVGFAEYSVSKLANVLFSSQLAKLLDGTGVTTYSLHPGVVASDIWRDLPWPIRKGVMLFMITPEEGAQTSIYCATSPDCAEHTGLYYDRCAPQRPSRLARDEALAEELCKKSMDWTARWRP